MEAIFSTSGYHYIAQKILKNLDDQSLKTLRQTNKNILDKCISFILNKAESQKNLDFRVLNCPVCHKSILKSAEYFVTFLEENQINHEFYFKYPLMKKGDEKMENILEQFLKKLFEMTPGMFRRKNVDYGKCICIQRDLTNIDARIYGHLFPRIKSIIPQLVKFIPANCPEKCKPYLIYLLRLCDDCI